MKKMLKTLVVLMTFVALLSLLTLFTSNADDVIGGDLTPTIKWTLVDGVLTLSGSGEAPGQKDNGKPWNLYMSSITDVVVEEGITCLGSDSFSYGAYLETVSLPSSLTELKQGVFYACNSITTVYYPGMMQDFSSKVTVGYYNEILFNAKWKMTENDSTKVTDLAISSFEEFDGSGEPYSCPFGSVLGGTQNMLDGDPNTMWGWLPDPNMGFIAHFNGEVYIKDIFLQTKPEFSMVSKGKYYIFALVDGNWNKVATVNASIHGVTQSLDVITSAIKVTIPEWHDSNWANVAELGFNGVIVSHPCADGHDETTHEGKAPTCTEIGWNEYITCSRCNYTNYEVLAALGHDEVAHEGKAPTCTEGGWAEYVTCSRCDYTNYEVLAALGHDEVAHEGKAPTCTEGGWAEYVTCSRCDYTTYEELAALGHDEIAHESEAPTCTKRGWNEYVTCSKCDYSTYEENAALGHDEIAHEGKAPTCTEIGWNEYVTCSRCDYTTKKRLRPFDTDTLTVSAVIVARKKS